MVWHMCLIPLGSCIHMTPFLLLRPSRKFRTMYGRPGIVLTCRRFGSLLLLMPLGECFIPLPRRLCWRRSVPAGVVRADGSAVAVRSLTKKPPSWSTKAAKSSNGMWSGVGSNDVGAGLSLGWRRLENVVQAGAVFRPYTHSSGAGLYPKIKPAPFVQQTCAAHATDRRRSCNKPAPLMQQTCANQ